MAEPALQFENVSKTFSLDRGRARSFKEAFVGAIRGRREAAEQLVALDDVSFALEAGGTLGLIGPNGTGKSTALKLAARILEPNSGLVRVRGRVAALLELGAGFHPDLTGRENVFLNGSLMGLDRRAMADRFDGIVEFAELARFIDMPVKHYSSGMYMRLGFATAIHVDPTVLLIDEVLAVGDQAFQHKCRERIAALHRQGVTIVLVSHASEAIIEVCERALWIEDGRVARLGPTDAVVDAYHRSVVAKEELRFAEEHGRDPATVIAQRDRWGSMDVEITSVELLNRDGQPQYVFLTGEPVTVAMHYRAARRIERPVFGMAIHRQDGLHVNGPNTQEAGLDLPFVEGEGTVTYAIHALPLTEGTYEVSAACFDTTCTHAFDYHHRRFPLRVRAAGGHHPYGAVVIPAEWAHQPAAPRGLAEMPAEATSR